jgi:hypothetical protein
MIQQQMDRVELFSQNMFSNDLNFVENRVVEQFDRPKTKNKNKIL